MIFKRHSLCFAIDRFTRVSVGSRHRIITPSDNSSVTLPATVTIAANASDSDGTISKVDFYNGATLMGTVTAAPYSVTLAGFTAGSYTFTAVATDNSNAATTSSAVTISVTAANMPPSVSIITPTDGSSVTLPATVTIAANATDSDGTISKVDFYSNATLMTTVTTTPYSVTLAGFNLGSYTFTAVATDNSNASTTSAPVSISIVNGASQVYYIHTDQLNTPRLITDSNNAKVWEWNNDDPFGNNPPNDDPNATGNHFVFNQRFAGQYADKETGLFYNWNRFYRPDTGTYDQSDLIGLGGGINTYSYALQNPLWYVDPLGLKVSIKCRPAKVAKGFVDHCWVETDTKSGGMGADPNVPPGEEYEGYGMPVFINDHSKDKATKSTEMKNVDEKCVNDKLQIGKPIGRFMPPLNQCQSFAYGIVNSCRVGPQETPQ